MSDLALTKALTHQFEKHYQLKLTSNMVDILMPLFDKIPIMLVDYNSPFKGEDSLLQSRRNELSSVAKGEIEALVKHFKNLSSNNKKKTSGQILFQYFCQAYPEVMDEFKEKLSKESVSTEPLPVINTLETIKELQPVSEVLGTNADSSDSQNLDIIPDTSTVEPEIVTPTLQEDKPLEESLSKKDSQLNSVISKQPTASELSDRVSRDMSNTRKDHDQYGGHVKMNENEKTLMSAALASGDETVGIDPVLPTKKSNAVSEEVKQNITAALGQDTNARIAFVEGHNVVAVAVKSRPAKLALLSDAPTGKLFVTADTDEGEVARRKKIDEALAKRVGSFSGRPGISYEEWNALDEAEKYRAVIKDDAGKNLAKAHKMVQILVEDKTAPGTYAVIVPKTVSYRPFGFKVSNMSDEFLSENEFSALLLKDTTGGLYGIGSSKSSEKPVIFRINPVKASEAGKTNKGLTALTIANRVNFGTENIEFLFDTVDDTTTKTSKFTIQYDGEEGLSVPVEKYVAVPHENGPATFERDMVDRKGVAKPKKTTVSLKAAVPVRAYTQDFNKDLVPANDGDEAMAIKLKYGFTPISTVNKTDLTDYSAANTPLAAVIENIVANRAIAPSEIAQISFIKDIFNAQDVAASTAMESANNELI